MRAGVVAACATLLLGCGFARAAEAHTSHRSTGSSKSGLPTIISAPSHLKPGQQAVVAADVGLNAACRLSLSRAHVRTVNSSYGASAGGALEWVWTVPRAAKSGTSVATVICANTRHRAHSKIHVSGRRRGDKAAATHFHVVSIKANESPLVSGLGGAGYPPYGSVMVPGSDWFGGHGVNVDSNGYGDNDNGRYQCVDLVTRFVAAEHFGPTIWGNANQLYQDAPSSSYVHHPNGSGYIPVAGDIITLAGGPYGHVVIVNQVIGDTIYVMEQNASSTGRSQLTIDTANGYISGEYGLGVIGTLHAKANTNPPGSSSPPPPSVPAPTVPPTQKAPPNSASATYQVYGTGSNGLFERTGPGTYSEAGWLPNGANVQISCQTTGSSVNGSDIWDLLTDGYYVADYYINTPDVGHYSPGIAQCVSTTPSPSPSPPTWHAPAGSSPGSYNVANTGGDIVYERSGPGTSYSKVGSLPAGAKIEIACQTTGTSVNGSDIWDMLTNGDFLSDYYTNTPNFDKYSPPLSQCEHS